jgi:hypothetical protein
MILVRLRKDGYEILGGGEVDRVVETWIGAHPSLEMASPPVYLSQELDL